jgi:hypothetical protein
MRHQPHWSHESAQHDAVLPRLKPAKSAVYDELRSNQLGKGVRLEQERIGYGWLEQALCPELRSDDVPEHSAEPDNFASRSAGRL